MKRRGFLQSLAGLIGVSIAPNVISKPINKRGETSVIQYIDELPFYKLSIDNFGAKDTIDLYPNISTSHLESGMYFYEQSNLFPKEAHIGYVFYFNPETYRTYPLDDKTKDYLHGSYIYTKSGWMKFACAKS